MDNDSREIGAALAVMYEMVSGPAGPRDWSKQDDVFHPACKQMRTGVDEAGMPWIKSFDLDQYSVEADAALAHVDFYEVELRREIRIFGNIAHVWSAYEAKTAPDDEVPERRGINSIQFYNDGQNGWRIISMIWDNERGDMSVDDTFPS